MCTSGHAVTHLELFNHLFNQVSGSGNMSAISDKDFTETVAAGPPHVPDETTLLLTAAASFEK